MLEICGHSRLSVEGNLLEINEYIDFDGAVRPTGKNLRIILLVRDLRPGGVPFTVGPLAREFMAQGHDVVIYNQGLESEIVADMFDGIRAISAGRSDGGGYRGHLEKFRKWKAFVREYQPDILQSHVGLPDIYAAFTPVSKTCKKVRAALAPNLFPAQPVFGFFFERLVSPFRFDHHVAVSKGVADSLRSTGISEKKITVILNPLSRKVVDAMGNDFSEKSPFEALNACTGARIAYFGRFSPEKGPDRILRWFDQLYPMLPRGSALFLGGLGKIEAELKAIASKLPSRDQIHFLGYISNPAEFLPYVHVTISPSRYEGLPIAMLEAAALGGAVAATDTAGARGLSDLVPDFKLLPNVDVLNLEVLSELSRWIGTRQKARRLPANLTQDAQHRLRPEAVAADYLSLYEKLRVRG